MRGAAALWMCLVLLGCAAPSPREAPLGPGEIRSAQAARDALAIGKSTKADVRAALGQATVIDFASGYEVWVYRERLPDKAQPPRTELVLLFGPGGTLERSRIR